ncbi:unnamed protein product [Phaeothamnion confervicola]
MANPTTVPDGRLPDADKGCLKGTIQHVRDVFGRMGFTDREMVALIGAHALGRCHVEVGLGFKSFGSRSRLRFQPFCSGSVSNLSV